MNLIRTGLIEISLMGAGMILLILLLRGLLKKHLYARTRMLLWYAAVLRLLIPFSIQAPPALSNWFYGLWEREKAGEMKGYAASDTIRVWIEGLPAENMAATLDAAAQDTAKMPVLSLVWLAGMVMILLYFAAAYIRCRSIFRESLPVKSGEAEGILKQLHIRRNVEIRSLDKITSPLTYGVLKPVILLPKKLLAGDDAGEQEELLRCILLHESVHIRRYDSFMKLMLVVVLAVHWFNPCVWLLYIAANRDMELCCDEIVVRRLGEEKRSFYASALLYMAERRSKSIVLNIYFSRNVLEERIRMIMEKKKITRLGTVLGGVVVVAICAVFALHADKSSASDDDASVNNQNVVSEMTMPEETTEEMPTVTETVAAAEPETQTEQQFIWPAEDCDRITSAYGERVHPITKESIFNDHITISGEKDGDWEGTDICAVADGVVTDTGFDTEKGNYIVLEHAGGLRTEYTHCKAVEIKTGESVQQGETIATLGKTGQATGPCLGFYVYEDGQVQNPLNYYPDIEIYK